MKKVLAVLFMAEIFIFCSVGAVDKNIKAELVFDTYNLQSNPLSNPESTIYHNGFIYVSNVDGNPSEKDGSGWITKFDLSGNVISEKWLSGLNAPKGMAIGNGKLYVTDIDRVLVIDISKAQIIMEIKFDKVKPLPEFLNDITIAPFGCIFISDSANGIVYKTNPRNYKVMVYLKSLPNTPNGLYATSNRFYIAGQRSNIAADKGKGRLFYIKFGDKKRTIHYVTEPLGALDGLTWFAKYKWLVSDHISGKIYMVDTKTKETTLILEDAKTTADISFVPEKSLLLIPFMQGNRLKAYKLIY